MESNGRFIVLLLFLITQVNSQLYEVHWLNGTEPTRPERDVQSSKQNIDIYCYNGTAKYLSTLWQTVEFQINIEDDEFSQYLGENPEEVYIDYKDGNDFSINPFLKKSYKTVPLDIFKPTCMAVNTTQNYNIELHIRSVDHWRVLMMIIGVSLIFASRSLSDSPVFFYLSGIVVGVPASFMFLVYYVTRFIPRRNINYPMLIGGCMVGVYLVQEMWEDILSIVVPYRAYLFGYTLIAGYISFVICYQVGPQRNRRNKNLIMWILERNINYPMLIGGCMVGVYLVQQMWEDILSIVGPYRAYLFGYTLIAGYISFVICYQVGPPRNRRSKNLFMWILEGVGVSLIVLSSQYREASTAVAVLSLGAKYYDRQGY